MRTLVQPANSPLGWMYSIPQWRCKNGHWNDVGSGARGCIYCEERPKLCETCGGDGRFEEEDHTTQCEPCRGWGVQWDWPTDETPPSARA